MAGREMVDVKKDAVGDDVADCCEFLIQELDCVWEAEGKVGVSDVAERSEVGNDTSLEDDSRGVCGAEACEELSDAGDTLFDLVLDIDYFACGAEIGQAAGDFFKIEEDKDGVGPEPREWALGIQQFIYVGAVAAYLNVKDVVREDCFDCDRGKDGLDGYGTDDISLEALRAELFLDCVGKLGEG